MKIEIKLPWMELFTKNLSVGLCAATALLNIAGHADAQGRHSQAAFERFAELVSYNADDETGLGGPMIPDGWQRTDALDRWEDNMKSQVFPGLGIGQNGSMAPPRLLLLREYTEIEDCSLIIVRAWRAQYQVWRRGQIGRQFDDLHKSQYPVLFWVDQILLSQVDLDKTFTADSANMVVTYRGAASSTRQFARIGWNSEDDLKPIRLIPESGNEAVEVRQKVAYLDVHAGRSLFVYAGRAWPEDQAEIAQAFRELVASCQ